jgi:hypothetical protein
MSLQETVTFRLLNRYVFSFGWRAVGGACVLALAAIHFLFGDRIGWILLGFGMVWIAPMIERVIRDILRPPRKLK